jgi:hypothetical protein
MNIVFIALILAIYIDIIVSYSPLPRYLSGKVLRKGISMCDIPENLLAADRPSISSSQSLSTEEDLENIDSTDEILHDSHDAADESVAAVSVDISSSSFVFNVEKNKYQKRRSNKYKRYADRLRPSNIHLSLLPYHDASLDLDDVTRISKQLGFVPYNLIKIGAYDHIDTKRPVVAVLYPLNADKIGGRFDESDGLKPFPTIYWLSCPIIHAKISQLEKAGWITIIETKLKENDYNNIFAESMRHSHDLYRQARLDLLHEEHLDYVEKNGW